MEETSVNPLQLFHLRTCHCSLGLEKEKIKILILALHTWCYQSCRAAPLQPWLPYTSCGGTLTQRPWGSTHQAGGAALQGGEDFQSKQERQTRGKICWIGRCHSHRAAFQRCSLWADVNNIGELNRSGFYYYIAIVIISKLYGNEIFLVCLCSEGNCR